MNPQDVAIAAGSGGGAFALVLAVALPLARRWIDGRLRAQERRSEVEIDGEAAEQRARIAVIEAQRKAVERVAETQERIAGALESWAATYTAIAQHAASVNDRLDRLEDAQGIRRGSAVPVPPPPRPPLSSSSDAGATTRCARAAGAPR